MEPFVAMIAMFGFNFAPRGWALCNGQILAISQNAALFSLIGTYYGGNGQSNFQLPNLQGRTAIHMGQAPGGSPYVIGQVGGTENTTLILSNLPAHTHTADISKLTSSPVATTNNATDVTPAPTLVPATLPSIGSGPSASPINGYAAQSGGALTNLYPSPASGSITIGATGQNIPFNNLSPYLTVNYCIALEGVFPSRN
ncbi:phage tail protein [Chitinophaga sp. Hz27]|uniref:phage tail protein n=1 Tax=Chitinophaga sp. Hz27 TaxID=3347169 RepID=UPI0035D56DD6